MTGIGRLLLLAILQDDRQLYGVERLFDSQQFENFELAVSASSSHSNLDRSGVSMIFPECPNMLRMDISD